MKVAEVKYAEQLLNLNFNNKISKAGEILTSKVEIYYQHLGHGIIRRERWESGKHLKWGSLQIDLSFQGTLPIIYQESAPNYFSSRGPVFVTKKLELLDQDFSNNSKDKHNLVELHGKDYQSNDFDNNSLKCTKEKTIEAVDLHQALTGKAITMSCVEYFFGKQNNKQQRVYLMDYGVSFITKKEDLLRTDILTLESIALYPL